MAEQNKQIDDFGEKIGGARKDLYYLNNGLFDVSVIKDWTVIERENLLTKKTVFPKPDYQKMKDEGMDIAAVYFVKRMYDSLPTKPARPTEEYQKGYVGFMNYFQQALSEVKTVDDACNFFKDKVLKSPYIERSTSGRSTVTAEAYGCMTNKQFKAAQVTVGQLYREAIKKQFLYSQEDKYLSNYLLFHYDGKNAQMEKQYDGRDALVARTSGAKYYFYNLTPDTELSNWKPDTYVALPLRDRFKPIEKVNFPTLEDAKNYAIELERAKEAATPQKSGDKERKKSLVPPQLSHIVRTGEDYRDGKNIGGQDMLDTFGFRGGEFGNWESQKDRQANLDMSFDAFKDMAVALGVQDKDISLGEDLAIAYGARGRGNAAAHYEPDRNVINLTKMSGAGSLAHEFGHALDRFLRKIECAEIEKSGGNIMGGTFASDFGKNVYNISPVAKAVDDLMSAIKYTDDSRMSYSDFYKNAKSLDKSFSRTGHQGKAYWSSNCELLARAFAVYVKDKLSEQGTKSPYLTGHAESVGIAEDGKQIPTFPEGDERLRINEAFDKVIEATKELGYLHQRENEQEQVKSADKPDNILGISEGIICLHADYLGNPVCLTEYGSAADFPEITEAFKDTTERYIGNEKALVGKFDVVELSDDGKFMAANIYTQQISRSDDERYINPEKYTKAIEDIAKSNPDLEVYIPFRKDGNGQEEGVNIGDGFVWSSLKERLEDLKLPNLSYLDADTGEKIKVSPELPKQKENVHEVLAKNNLLLGRDDQIGFNI